MYPTYACFPNSSSDIFPAIFCIIYLKDIFLLNGCHVKCGMPHLMPSPLNTAVGLKKLHLKERIMRRLGQLKGNIKCKYITVEIVFQLPEAVKCKL